MRPVNLIPPEERHGERPPLRTGPLAYAIVAVLALALIGVTLMVMTSNKVTDNKSEVESLKAQVQAAEAQAKRLSSYTSFAAMQQMRQDTVTSLAKSRFDWERVLREVAIVIPNDVWLTNLTASAAAGADASGSSSTSGSSAASGSAATAGITGPSLDIQGCAAGHEAVARFLAALREVDGITRVSVMSSDRPDQTSSTGTTSSSTGEAGSVSCSTRNFISTFEVIAAFDGVPPATPAVAPSTSPVAPTSGSSEATPTSSDSQSSGAAPTAVVSGTGSTP